MSDSKDKDIIIRVSEITKTFNTGGGHSGKLEVLRGITMDVQRGEIMAIVGASGAGKSTLLHIMGTLDRPTSGQIFYDHLDAFSLDDDSLARFRNREIGFVFQFHHLLPEFTLLENVAMPALIMGQEMSEAKNQALQILREVGIEGKADAEPPELSGGEQQRAAVARALMNAPRVVLADEPSGNLDTANAQSLHELIWNLSRSRGQTFVVVTHNESLAKQADRVVKIVDGHV
ncbi:MAG: ABC transporter ATP-binding protein [Ignavibacteriae bacterium]|nr:ABC transporter ATP-binding protein [Ignavibacteriota bacterium]